MAKIFMESANLFSDMSEYKSNTSPNDICSDERTKCLLPILEEAYSYGYSDTPQYGKLIFLLELQLIKIACIPDNFFTWFQANPNYCGRPISLNKYELMSDEGQLLEEEMDEKGAEDPQQVQANFSVNSVNNLVKDKGTVKIHQKDDDEKEIFKHTSADKK